MNQIAAGNQKSNADRPEQELETVVESPETAETAAPRDLDSIREIIFGSYIRDYNTRFRKVDKELERLQQLVEERFAELDTRFNQKVEEINADLRKGLKDIERQLNERIDQAISKGEGDHRKLSTLIDSLAEELREKTDRINNNYTNQVGELREQMRRNYDTLRNELITETDTLDESKLDRSALAETLIDLGMKLKDESLLDELSTQVADD